MRLFLIDSTLRDGEQAPGVFFLKKEKIRLAQMLSEIGIDEIEIGTPSMGRCECDTIRDIMRLNLKSVISVWSRAIKKDIEKASTLGVDGIHIAFPLSNIQLHAMNKTYKWVEDTLDETVQCAKGLFKQVSIGIQDASRSSLKRIIQFVDMLKKYEIFRIRLADTVGILTPIKTIKIIQAVKKKNMNIDFHAHNDFGMATANAVTAYQIGANFLSVTVNGLGERAGNAALEEVLVTLKCIGVDFKYDISTLFDLCKYVSIISRRPLPVGKAICGQFAVSHESGIHTHAVLSNMLAFQPFNGKVIGREDFSILFGKHSGKNAIISCLKKQNIKIKNCEVPLLIKKIKNKAYELQRSLSADEIVNLYLNKNV
ncbi:MAG: homocitrate synthase [Bacteroidales bacterium OttesenSCG-928-I14]|jgi:homocitrate synthase NifV|nr:homocitrate synthase [Bacteroidales bacterium OttesenSCG-928-I14]